MNESYTRLQARYIVMYVPPHRRRGVNHDSKLSNLKVEERSSDENHTSDKVVSQICKMFTKVYCINLKEREDRWNSFQLNAKKSFGKRGEAFMDKITRFDAVHGADLLEAIENGDCDIPSTEVPFRRDWDATKNALYDRHIEPPMRKRLSAGEIGCAVSHVKLWRKFLDSTDEIATMLILEDDAIFYQGSKKAGHKGEKSFYTIFSSLIRQLPHDWDILYLGFSDRGERIPVKVTNSNSLTKYEDVMIFKPEYGFHTHAYALTKKAAQVLLQNLPVIGPIDVWLADNQWFGLNVYCSIVKNEGWKGSGAYLVSQKKYQNDSNIDSSGRRK